MPTRPKKYCAFPRCHQVLPGGQTYCEAHKKRVGKSYEATRETAVRRGYTHRWNKARKVFLSAHPLCAYCLKEGRTVQARVVDHIIPHRGDDNLFWDESNWQPLCVGCHNRKSAHEKKGVPLKKRGAPHISQLAFTKRGGLAQPGG